MRVVVCTVVHHPADARIFYREIAALLDAGHDVTYIAPHDEASASADKDTQQSAERERGSLTLVPIPRAVGRRRAGPTSSSPPDVWAPTTRRTGSARPGSSSTPGC
jgi:hypothetical protein